LDRGNIFDSDHEGFKGIPEAYCIEKENDYGEMSRIHCVGLNEYIGSWYQPTEADSYENNFRIDTG
jgi:hypothetical protein